MFTNHLGRPLSGRNVLRAISDVAKYLGLEDVNVHSLRHTFATDLIENGMADKGVAKTLGHTDTRVTAKYTHPSDTYIRRGIEERNRRWRHSG